MNLIAIALMLLPMLSQSAGNVPPEIQAASNRTAGFVAVALAETKNYEPAWEEALRSEIADSPVYTSELISYIREAAQETGVRPAVIWAVMYTETHGRHWNDYGVVKRGSAGEIGAMQVQPWWQRGLKRKYGVDLDLYDLRDNVRAGAYILSRGGDELNVMLSYYNTGQRLRSTPYQRKVERYLDAFTGESRAVAATDGSNRS